LFVVHEYLPQSLAFWLPALVSVFLSQGKKVTVLVKEEVRGWSKTVDEIYPTDMVLTIDSLKQIISIPVDSEEFGSLSYEIQENVLRITLIPNDAPADVRHLETSMFGDIYDQVIGVGLTAKHDLFATLQKAKTPLAHASYFFIGGVSPKSSLEQVVPSTTEKVEVLEETNMQSLIEIIEELSKGTYTETARELLALYLYFSQSLTQATFGFKEYSLLADLSMKGLQTERMSKILTLDTDVANQIITALLSNVKASTKEDTLLFLLTKEVIRANSWTIEQLLLASYYLPKYVQVKNIVVIYEFAEYEQHIIVSGDAICVKQVAVKYGFPYTEEITGGKVVETSSDKLQTDVFRVLTEEELQKNTVEKVVSINTIPVLPKVSSPIIYHPEQSKQKLDDIAKKEEIAMGTSEKIPSTVQNNQQQVNVRQKLDFSTLAQKMKDSAIQQGN
jgi:hypothetical protein